MLLFTATCYPSSFKYFVSLISAHYCCIPLPRRHGDSTGNHEQQCRWSRCMDVISPLTRTLPQEESLRRALPLTGLARNASTRALHEAWCPGRTMLVILLSMRPLQFLATQFISNFDHYIWLLLDRNYMYPGFWSRVVFLASPQCNSDIDVSLAPTLLSDNSPCVSQAPCVSMTPQHRLSACESKDSPSSE